jgi:YkoY family integral membrane protein
MHGFFHQTFEPRDLVLVLTLVLLEALLSLDNALALGLLAARLPRQLQGPALVFGLAGSLVFRLLAVIAAAWLLKWRWVKLLGGGYLLYVAAGYFFTGKSKKTSDHATANPPAFWPSVISIELTDIAFAADSILAGIALVGPLPAGSVGGIHPKLWVIILGGMIGVILMRFAAAGFIRLLRQFPRFETSAYLLVSIVALKLLADFWFNAGVERLNFESPSSAVFWIFWSAMAVCFTAGFFPSSVNRAD